jgi:hypothetical protein
VKQVNDFVDDLHEKDSYARLRHSPSLILGCR